MTWSLKRKKKKTKSPKNYFLETNVNLVHFLTIEHEKLAVVLLYYIQLSATCLLACMKDANENSKQSQSLKLDSEEVI